MKIELKNIKHAEFASEETDCFSASVYIDGERVGTVENEGHGGSNRYHPNALGVRLETYAKTLPATPHDIGDGKIMMLDSSADMLIDDLLENHLARTRLQRLFKRRLLFRKGDGKIYESQTLDANRMQKELAKGAEALKKALGATVVLNLLPIDEAVAEYRRKPPSTAAAA